MAIYTKAKVVTDGVFQRGETNCLWYCGQICFVSLKSGSHEDCCFLQRQFRSKLLALSGRGKAEGGHKQMGSTTGLCKFN